MYVRPILEYSSCIWSPHKLHYIDQIESFQKRITKRVNGLQSDPYSVRLTKLSLGSLELRRLRFDLIMIFNIIHGFVEVDVPNLFNFSTSNCTGGNMFKWVKTNCKTDPELFSFPNRAVTAWNSLSNEIVSSITVSAVTAWSSLSNDIVSSITVSAVTAWNSLPHDLFSSITVSAVTAWNSLPNDIFSSITVSAVTIWNSLPNDLFSSITLSAVDSLKRFA